MERRGRQAAGQRVIQETIATCRGNLSAAARLLGLSRSTLYKRLKQLTQAREAAG